MYDAETVAVLLAQDDPFAPPDPRQTELSLPLPAPTNQAQWLSWAHSVDLSGIGSARAQETARLILVFFAYEKIRWNPDDAKYACAWPSLNTIAKHVRRSKPVVCDSLKRLESAGILKRERRTEGKRGHVSTLYRLETGRKVIHNSDPPCKEKAGFPYKGSKEKGGFPNKACKEKAGFPYTNNKENKKKERPGGGSENPGPGQPIPTDKMRNAIRTRARAKGIDCLDALDKMLAQADRDGVVKAVCYLERTADTLPGVIFNQLRSHLT